MRQSNGAYYAHEHKGSSFGFEQASYYNQQLKYARQSQNSIQPLATNYSYEIDSWTGKRQYYYTDPSTGKKQAISTPKKMAYTYNPADLVFKSMVSKYPQLLDEAKHNMNNKSNPYSYEYKNQDLNNKKIQAEVFKLTTPQYWQHDSDFQMNHLQGKYDGLLTPGEANNQLNKFKAQHGYKSNISNEMRKKGYVGAYNYNDYQALDEGQQAAVNRSGSSYAKAKLVRHYTQINKDPEVKYGPKPKKKDNYNSVINSLLPNGNSPFHADFLVKQYLTMSNVQSDPVFKKNIAAHFYSIKDFMNSVNMKDLAKNSPTQYAGKVTEAIRTGNYYTAPNNRTTVKVNHNLLNRQWYIDSAKQNDFVTDAYVFAHELQSTNGDATALQSKDNQDFVRDVYKQIPGLVTVDFGGTIDRAIKNIEDLRKFNSMQAGKHAGQLTGGKSKRIVDGVEDLINRRLYEETPGSSQHQNYIDSLEIFNESMARIRSENVTKFREDAEAARYHGDRLQSQGKFQEAGAFFRAAIEADRKADEMALVIS